MHKFAKRVQTRCTELAQSIERDHGLKGLPIALVFMMVAIPFMLIEMLTWTAAENPVCDHRIDNKRPGYRKDPHCSRCGKPLCTARNERGGVCMKERGHAGFHHNPFLKDNSEWRSTGSTLLNDEFNHSL